MIRPRRVLTLLLAVSLLLALGAQGAAAKTTKKPKGPLLGLTVLPEKPLVSDGLQVSFTAGRLAAGERYDVSISIPYTGDGEKGCRYTQSLRVRGARKPGRRVSVSLVPKAFSSFGTGRFCEGRATLRLSRVDVDDHAVVLAKRAFALTPDNPGVQEPVSTPVRMDILDGSALLVQAPGRPDRTLPVGGVLHGGIPGKFRPNTDIQVTNLSGPIFLRSVTPDPLCAGATYTSELGLSTPPAIALKASGDTSMPLTFAVSPTALAGCAGAPAGTTPLTFTGKVGPQGLVRLAISATAAVQIADGVTATVTANLIVKIDLSGKN